MARYSLSETDRAQLYQYGFIPYRLQDGTYTARKAIAGDLMLSVCAYPAWPFSGYFDESEYCYCLVVIDPAKRSGKFVISDGFGFTFSLSEVVAQSRILQNQFQRRMAR